MGIVIVKALTRIHANEWQGRDKEQCTANGCPFTPKDSNVEERKKKLCLIKQLHVVEEKETI